jgi:hypothetical protein
MQVNSGLFLNGPPLFGPEVVTAVYFSSLARERSEIARHG